MKRNLLYIVTKLELGGAQKHVLDLVRHADRDRFNLFLFTAKEGLLASEASSQPELFVYFSRFLDRPLNVFSDFMAFFEIVAFIRKNDIDIVHTHSSKAGIIGRWAGWLARAKIIVHTVHGWSFNDYQPFIIKRLFIALERGAAKITDKIIVVSSWDRELAAKHRIGEKDQYVLVPYGIDIEGFSKKNGSMKKELGLDEGDLVVGSVSCLKKQKAPQDFVRLAGLVKKTVPRVKFLLAGDGELMKEVGAIRRDLGLEKDVIFLGWQKDIPRFLGTLDVFVLTSLWEGLPISVLEAMASSKAVLVTDTGGVRDIIRDGRTGYLAPVRDLKALEEKLVCLLTDTSRRRRCAEAARGALTHSFHVETMARDVSAVYGDLLKQKGAKYAG